MLDPALRDTTATTPAHPPAPAGPDTRRARLKVEGVTKTWDPRRGPLLEGVDLVIEPRQLVSVTGHNGAGKTTFLRIVGGLIAADSGRVTLDGRDPIRHRRAYQQQIGYLSAGQGGLYARLTTRHHLEYWARLALVPAAHRKEALARVAQAFALEELLPQRVDRLSMGQRQRVRLAMAFLHEPTLVLLDEPQNSLDPDAADLLVAAVTSFTTAGGTAIWCSPTAGEHGVAFDASYVLENRRLVAR